MVYVVSLFPSWSETFIVREVATLLENGVDVRIISLKRPSQDLVQSDAAALLARVRYPRTVLHTLAGTLAAFARNPRSVAGSFATVVAGLWRQPVVLLKSLFALMRGLEQAAWLRGFDPQIIHAHWATYPSTAAWALGRALRKPFSFTCHAHDIFVDHQLLARKIEDAALAVTISRYNVGWLHTHATSLAEHKLKVIHCGVDMDKAPWRSAGRESGMLLAVGRLDPVKGFATLIEALALLEKRGVEFACRIAGSGPLDADLRRLAQNLGVSKRIEFAGAQPQRVVREWMDSATLFVLPSEVAADGNRDGIPVALMEAMASGCPVVSTRVSGIPELVEDGITGLLVGEQEPAALAAAIERLLQDENLRGRLATGARRHVEREFDARTEAGRLQAYMGRLVDAG
ncbi:MAG TPA: glycosyltransferase [Pseudoxanthomonas sp.]